MRYIATAILTLLIVNLLAYRSLSTVTLDELLNLRGGDGNRVVEARTVDASAVFVAGDVDIAGNQCFLSVIDGDKTIRIAAPFGSAMIGDTELVGNGSAVVVDDLNEIIVFTKPFATQSRNGHWWLFATDNGGVLSSVDLGTSLP